MAAIIIAGSAEIIDFKNSGAVPCKRTLLKVCTSTTDMAIKNTMLMNVLLSRMDPGDKLLVPNATFLMMGGVYAKELADVTLQIDGTLLFSDDITAWPTQNNGTSKMPIIAMTFEHTTDFTVTSNGTGVLNGNGAAWWGIPGIGYLERGKNRPPMMSINFGTNFLLEHIDFLQAPRFNFVSQALLNATIRYCNVDSRRTSADSHGVIDITAFNTDGFDVSGNGIHIHDCTVWNQDDTFCIKASGGDTSNVLIENVRASGVGLSIGSIGGNAVSNITFRNVVMHHTYKGIYIKWRSSAAFRGLITNVTYENIYIDEPESWPIWIGPQQAGIKEAGKDYNPCNGDPCSLCWPTLKSSSCPGVPGLIDGLTLRNITVKKPRLSPGVIIGNISVPMKNIVFDSVRFIDPPVNGAFGTDYFYCEGVENAVAIGDTWPVPPCFTDQSTTRSPKSALPGLR